MAIHKYNAFMNGVDKSDQILNTNYVLCKCVHWWKTLFFHMINLALVNGYILFQSHSKNNPDNELLKRPQRHCLQNFKEVVQSVAELGEYGIPKTDQWKSPSVEPSVYETVYIPILSIEKRNCKVCYKDTKRELKVKSYCSAPQCSVYLHCTNDKNCFAIWHSKRHHCWFTCKLSLIVWSFLESILPTDIVSMCSPYLFVFIWETDNYKSV